MILLGLARLGLVFFLRTSRLISEAKVSHSSMDGWMDGDSGMVCEDRMGFVWTAGAVKRSDVSRVFPRSIAVVHAARQQSIYSV